MEMDDEKAITIKWTVLRFKALFIKDFKLREIANWLNKKLLAIYGVFK